MKKRSNPPQKKKVLTGESYNFLSYILLSLPSLNPCLLLLKITPSILTFVITFGLPHHPASIAIIYQNVTQSLPHLSFFPSAFYNSPFSYFKTKTFSFFISFLPNFKPQKKNKKEKINICFDRPAVMWLTRSSADSISVPVPSVPPHSGFVSSLAVHVFPPPSVSAHNHRSVYHSIPPSSSPSALSPTGSPLPVATHQNKPCKHWISQSRLAVFLSAQLLGSKSTSRMSETSTQRNVNVYQLLHFQFRFGNCCSHLTLYKLKNKNKKNGTLSVYIYFVLYLTFKRVLEI